jgi:Protein of unknown function (DUF4236)
MGFRYRKSLRLSRGMRLNLTKRGISSVSMGRPGSMMNIGQKGVRSSLGIPGSGLSYSSRRTSASGVLPALIIAIFGGILVAAIRGNRLAQLALVVILIPCIITMFTHHVTEQTEALSINAVPQGRLQIDASPDPGSAFPTGALRDHNPFAGVEGGASAQSKDSVAHIKPGSPPGTETGGPERALERSDQRGIHTTNLSNHATLMNLAAAPNALRIQQRLISLGYRIGTPDGVWGVKSQVSLDEFRRKHRLSGRAPWDIETQAALFSETTMESGSDLEVGQSEVATKASSVK